MLINYHIAVFYFVGVWDAFNLIVLDFSVHWLSIRLHKL